MTKTLFRSSLVAAAAMLIWSPPVRAQNASNPPSTTQSAGFFGAASDNRKPATVTFLGDTGIWYVPTAEVLASGTWSIGGPRRGTNYVQGFTKVADFATAGAVGIGSRVEVFGSFLVDTRVRRSDAPIFSEDSRGAGIVARSPGVNESWTGNDVGDLYFGSKVNLFSQYRAAPMGLALRDIVKLFRIHGSR